MCLLLLTLLLQLLQLLQLLHLHAAASCSLSLKPQQASGSD